MKINTTVKYDFDDFLIEPKWSESPTRDIPLLRNYRFKYSPIDYSGVPLIASNMDTTGTVAMAASLNKLECSVAFHKFYKPEEIKNSLQKNWFTIGIKEKDINRLDSIWPRPPFICIDVANGYTQDFVKFVSRVRFHCQESVIMAGNVATPAMAQALILNGKADIVKVGIGPGSVCTTRLITGVGYPQASAIAECADIAHGLKAHICADGGCKNPADVSKAFGLGADFVMIGGLLAGTEECEGKWSYKPFSGERYMYCEPNSIFTGDPSSNYRTTWPEGFRPAHLYAQDEYQSVVTHDKTKHDHVIKQPKKQSLAFHGMSSEEAHELHYGPMQDYKTAEGVEITVSYKGPAKDVILKIMGGIRSACAYVGANTFKDFSKCCTFNVVHRPKEYLFSGITP